MKTTKSNELFFTATRETNKTKNTKNTKNTEDCGMYFKPSKKRENCSASKRSSVQGFTFG